MKQASNAIQIEVHIHHSLLFGLCVVTLFTRSNHTVVSLEHSTHVVHFNFEMYTKSNIAVTNVTKMTVVIVSCIRFKTINNKIGDLMCLIAVKLKCNC